MILYIAGPMTGHDQHNYPAFLAAEQQLRAAGYDVLNPALIDELCALEEGERTWAWYMRRALRMLTSADGVALLPGWFESKGATIEAELAERLGMRLWGVGEWIDDVARAEQPQEATA